METETDTHTQHPGERLTRRNTIARLGGLVAVSLGAAGLEATSSAPAQGQATGPQR